MNLGETTTYEAWVLRYGDFCLFSSCNETSEDALAYAKSCGHSVDNIEVVRITTNRCRVAVEGFK